ncbi:hypothetical protein HDU89_006832 [Geranomyces variabilis]|nr:hypothetical protein HDU89_006832 [Geranomyces variabilis]
MSTRLLKSSLSTLSQMPSPPPPPPPLCETNSPQLRYPAASAAFNNETARAPSSYSPSYQCSQPVLALPGFATMTRTTTTTTTTTTTANANAAAVAAANARAGHSSSSGNSRGKTAFSHLPTHAQQQQRRKKLGRFRPPRMRGPNHPATAMMSTAPPTTAAPTAAVAGAAAPASSSSAPPRQPPPPPPTRKLHQTRRVRCRNNNSHRPPLAFLPPAPPQFPHPPQRRKKGDFYRPVSSSLRREATLNNSLPPPNPNTDPNPALLLQPCLAADPPLPNAQTPDLESLLDDVFADLAALSREQEEDDGDDDYDPEGEEDFCTPPLAGWLYPDETYAADRAKFSDVGGTTLDRTFIGMPVPEDVLDGVDSRL